MSSSQRLTFRKRRRWLIALAVAAGFAGGWQAGHADDERMDEKSLTLVVEKLERALELLPAKDPSRGPSYLRLADMLSERARLRSSDDNIAQGKSCQGDCSGGRKDRVLSLKYYALGIDYAPRERRGELLLHISHVHEILGDKKAALKPLQQIEREGARRHSREVMAQAYARFGEIHFALFQFRASLSYLNRALSYRELKGPGQVLWRRSWVYLNLGQDSRAKSEIVKVLKSPELRSEGALWGDAARDLVVFVARQPVRSSDVDLVENLSPKEARKENLYALGTQLDRLGQKGSALLAWAAYSKYAGNSIERIETSLRVAENQWKNGNNDQAVEHLQRASKIWREEGCNDKDECERLRKQFRLLIVEWTKVEKLKPSAKVAMAAAAYTSLFPADYELAYARATVLRTRKDLRGARAAFASASDAVVLSFPQSAMDNLPAPVQAILSDSILSELQMAELTKSRDLRRESYDHVLKVNPLFERAPDVLYSRAYVDYEEKKLTTAAVRFHDLALGVGTAEASARSSRFQSSANLATREKSGHMALESLATLHDEDRLEIWSTEFASALPRRKQEYLLVGRKAVVRRAERLAQGPRELTAERTNALNKLKALDVQGANVGDRREVYEAAYQLGLANMDIVSAKWGASSLVALPHSSDKNTESDLEKRIYLAELELDFSTAYHLSLRSRMPKFSAADRELRLSMLAELAGHSPAAHEKAYLKLAGQSSKRGLIWLREIRRSHSPAEIFWAHQSELRRNAQVYGEAAALAYFGTRSLAARERIVSKVANDSMVRSSEAGREWLWYVHSLRAAVATRKALGESKRDVVARVKEKGLTLAELERDLKMIARNGSPLAQATMLYGVAEISRSLAQDLAEAPRPRGLKAAQKQRYDLEVEREMNRLSGRAVQAEQRASALGERVAREARPDIESGGTSAFLARQRVNLLLQVASGEVSDQLRAALRTDSVRADRTTILAARDAVRESPFSAEPLKKLKALEEQAGHDVWVTYLELRLNQLESRRIQARREP